MTKTTYKRHINKYLDVVIHKYGFEHPATIRFAEQAHKYLQLEPTEEHDRSIRHFHYTMLRYGADLEEE